MKKLIFALIMLFSFSIVAVGQTTLTQEEINQLPIEMQNKIKEVKTKDEVEKQIEDVGKWANLGKEVGVAVNESLSAVTKTATDFSHTGLGKLTIALVVYKVIGRDILHYFIGFVFLVFSIFLYRFIHKKFCVPQKILDEEVYNEETKKTSKSWSYEKPEDMEEWKITNIIILGVCIVIFLITIFSA